MREALGPQQWTEFESLKLGKAWAEVPLLPWAPVISPEEAKMIAGATERLHKSLLDLGKRELQAGRVNQWIPYLAGLRESVLCQTSENPDFHWRYDFLWDRVSGKLTFIEVNAGDPSGLGWITSFTSCMFAESFWKELWGDKVRASLLFESHRDALSQRIPPKPNPVVRLLSAENSTVASDILCLAQQYQQLGWDAKVVEPRELSLGHDGVKSRGVSVDVLLRDTYEELYWSPYEKIGPKLQALVEAGKVLVLNPFSASFWDSKSLWAQVPPDLGAAETVKLSDWDETLKSKDDWVLKPSYDYGGRGVVCGFASSLEEWTDALDLARNSERDWVVQRAAVVPCEELPFLNDRGEVEWAPRFLTWSAFINNGRCPGFFARSSKLPVVNVHNGGAIFPVLVSAV